MAYTEYNLMILSHVLAKFSITLREIFWSLYMTFHTNYSSSQSCDINWLVICTDGSNPSRICRVRIVAWPKKLAPCILAHEVGPGCHDRKMFIPCWSSGAAIATWRDQLELVYMYLGTIYISTEFRPDQTSNWPAGGNLGKPTKCYWSWSNDSIISKFLS
jgi:hypothetical protein